MGILITTNGLARPEKTATGYRFRMDDSEGWYWQFYRVENGRTYGVFDDSLLEGFQVLASDGAYLNYVPTDGGRCA